VKVFPVLAVQVLSESAGVPVIRRSPELVLPVAGRPRSAVGSVALVAPEPVAAAAHAVRQPSAVLVRSPGSSPLEVAVEAVLAVEAAPEEVPVLWV